MYYHDVMASDELKYADYTLDNTEVIHINLKMQTIWGFAESVIYR